MTGGGVGEQGAALRIRRAVLEDAAPIALIHVRTWQAAYRGLMPDKLLDGLSIAEREDLWRGVLTEDEGPAVYVAITDDAVVGFCAVAAPSRDADAQESVAEIGAIYVHPDVWRLGVGRALMDAALGGLRAAGWRWVTLWVFAENQRARDFYARFGLGPDGAETTDDRSGQKEVRLRGSLTVDLPAVS